MTHALDALRGYAEIPNGIAALARLVRETGSDEIAVVEEVAAAFRPAMISPADLAQAHYSAVIINLSGLLEAYIEDLLSTLILHLEFTANRWEELPEALRRNNTIANLELIGAIQDGRRSYDEITLETVVSHLNSCLTEDVEFTLTPEAFAYHSSNFRHGTATRAFSRIGVQVSSVGEISGDRLAEGDVDVPAEWESPIADELAIRRNQVAHGRPTSLLSPGLLQVLIDAVGVYVRALSDAVMDFAIRNAIRLGQFAELGRPDRSFQHGRVIGYESTPMPLAEGDLLAIVPGSGWATLVSVVSLEVNRTRVANVVGGTPVGIGLTRPISARNRAWLVPPEFAHGSGLLDGPLE